MGKSALRSWVRQLVRLRGVISGGTPRPPLPAPFLRTRDGRAAVDGRAEREGEGHSLLIDGACRRFQRLVRHFVSEDLFNLADGGVVHDLAPFRSPAAVGSNYMSDNGELKPIAETM